MVIRYNGYPNEKERFDLVQLGAHTAISYVAMHRVHTTRQ